MLRASLKTRRPLALRQFHSTALAWNSSVSPRNDSGTSKAGSPTPISPPEPSQGAQASSSSEHSATTDSRDGSPSSLTALKVNLSNWSNQAAILFRRRADEFTSSTKATFSSLGAQLNKVTGYEEIDALKRQVVEQDARIKESRQAARLAKQRYAQAVHQRSNSQREVNDLLQRKSTWTDNDVSRFTHLVREDHLFEQEEHRAKVAVDEVEAAVEKEFSELMRSILARYHEEQVWSDKIRSASTYGQMAALGLNLLVFVLAIVIVEPWKRKRLAQTFEKKIEEMEAEYTTLIEENMGQIQRQLEDQAAILGAVTGAISRMDTQMQQTKEVVREEVNEPELTAGIWTKAVKDRNFGEAVAMGAMAASVLSALGWIWLGG